MNTPIPSPSVWLVDSDTHQHSAIRWSIARAPYAVDFRIFKTAGDAIGALERESIPPDVIVSDLALRDMSGLRFLEWMKHSRFSTVPVVVRSTSQHAEDIGGAYRAGARAYVIKSDDLHLIERNFTGITCFFCGLTNAAPDECSEGLTTDGESSLNAATD